jgi:hypothetical protein
MGGNNHVNVTHLHHAQGIANHIGAHQPSQINSGLGGTLGNVGALIVSSSNNNPSNNNNYSSIMH